MNSVDEDNWWWQDDECRSPALTDDRDNSWSESQWKEDSHNEAEAEQTAGSLDFHALEEVSAFAEADFRVPWNGEQWVRLNYDTGAATTALPASLAEGLPLKQVGEFVVASGHGIPNLGCVKAPMKDEQGNSRS